MPRFCAQEVPPETFHRRGQPRRVRRCRPARDRGRRPRHGHEDPPRGIQQLEGHGDGLGADGPDRSAPDRLSADEGSERVDEGAPLRLGPRQREAGELGPLRPGVDVGGLLGADDRADQDPARRDPGGLDRGDVGADPRRRGPAQHQGSLRARGPQGEVRRQDRLPGRSARHRPPREARLPALRQREARSRVPL